VTLRILRVLTRPNLGGPTLQAVALWHAHRELGAQTLLVTGAVDATESRLDPAEFGVPRLGFAAALAAGPAAAGLVELPSLGRGIQPWRDLRALWALRALASSFAPQVLHTHTTKAGWLGRSVAAAGRMPCVAHTFHGHVLRDYFRWPMASFLARLERYLAQRTQLLCAVSPSCADELAAAKVAPRERFVVTWPAVPLAACQMRHAARAALGIDPTEWRVVTVGRLVPIKRLEHFVAALAPADGPAGDLVGSGPQQAKLAAAATGRGPRLRLLGPRADIAALLPAYDALVLPSVREGCPLVAVEAFAAGVPVVGYDVPGVRDVLVHPHLGPDPRGLLVPEAEGPEGLRRALLSLRARPELAAALVAAGRAALPHFAPRRLAAQLLAAYTGGAFPVPAKDALA